MKMLKKIIIIISIILIILIITIASIIIIKRYKENNIDMEEEIKEEAEYKANEFIEDVENRNKFYAVKSIIENYISNISFKENEIVYNMLDSDYINEFNITKDNVIENVSIPSWINQNEEDEYLDNQLNITIDKMYYKEISLNFNVFFAYGIVRNKSTSEINEFCVMVKLNSTNNTYYIIPQNYMEKYGFTNKSDSTILNNYKTSEIRIQNNTYNVYKVLTIDDTTVISDYISNFKDKIIYRLEDSYENIDKEYREKKFESYEEYKSFIKNNMRDLLSINVDSYKKINYDTYIQYICKVGNKYYTINENNPMQYTLILDSYTIDLPEFTQKYNSARDENKVAMNIEKIKEALNNKDYKYIYSKLDKTFKINNFPEQISLEENLKNNLFSSNEFEYTNINEQSGIYTFSINITEKGDNTGKKRMIDIIMKLEEGTDFVMSFKMKEEGE